MEKDFLIDIDKTIQPKDYNLILCKLNGEQLQELHNIDGFEIKKYFIDIDEIRFEVPLYRMENDGKVKNELFDLVDGSMLVLLDNSKYFILTKPEIKANNETGETYKSALGFSREYEFVYKKLSGYSGVSRQLYSSTNEKDENGLEIGFLNYIEKTTSWEVGYIHPDLLLKYRSLNFSSATYLQAFQEVQKTFGCLFKYDTINKIIDVYKNDQLGTNQGLLISDYNFINNLNQTIDHNEVVTRLYLYGKDNVSIQSINITGQPYIDNFSFFKNTKYMSQSLIDALDTYEAYIETKQSVFSGYLTQLNTLNDTLTTKQIELAELITELKLIESNLDVAIASGQSTTALQQQQTAKILQINNKQLEIESIMTQIDTVHTNINNLSIDISLNSHLIEEQAKELDTFIREDEYRDNNYTEDNLEEFLKDGTDILKRVSYPNLIFDIDVDDFLTLIEGQHLRDKFILGDLVTIEYEELGFNYEVRLVGYTHNPEDKKLSLIFSNRNSVDDANIYISDLLESITTTASTVDFSRYKWDKGEEAKFIINEYVNNALNLAKQQIIKADGQKPMADERGIWLIKENPDGTVDKGQLRLIHNCIALTNDNWNSLEIAISAEMGINANLIRGKIGEFAQLNANQIVVGDEEQELLDYIDQQKSDLDDAINNLDDVITDAFSDNYITNIEAQSLEIAYESLAEKAWEVFWIGLTASENYVFDDAVVWALNAAISDLEDTISLYIHQETYPIAVTAGNRVVLKDRFTSVEQLVIEVLDIVEEARNSGTKDYVDSQIDTLDEIIGDLELSINDFSDDGKLTLAEANSLKIVLEDLRAGVSALINIGMGLGLMTEVDALISNMEYLYSRLKRWIDLDEYPVDITEVQREAILTDIRAIQTAKLNLITAIDAKRDESSIKDGINYNGTVIDKENGITVTRSDNKIRTRLNATDGIKIQGKNGNDWQDRFYVDTNGNVRITSPDILDLATGISGGIVDITSNGIEITHTGTNSKTIMDIDGFKRQIISSGNVYNYINLSHSDEATTTGSYSQTGDEYNPITPKTTSYLDSAGVGVNWITIPNLDFKNRNFVVIPSLLSIGSMNTGESGGSYTTVWSHYLKTDLKVLSYDFINGRFQIRARKCEYAMYRGDYMFEKWNPVTISYYVYATS